MQWIVENRIGDLASIAGVFITIVGFLVTLWNVWRSRSAAERAEMAANEARRMIRSYETVAEFSSAITLMEEIKRLHRSRQLEMLPDRYAALRKALIGVRRLAPSIRDSQDVILQTAITTLATIEDTIEKSIHGGSLPDYARLNRLLSRDIDALHGVLIDIKAAGEGPRNEQQ
ncbi:MAG: hypothetical protein AB7H90_17305 [Alphaproteobacteria bacterium]